jgi:large subunit ribosomal protein L4
MAEVKTKKTTEKKVTKTVKVASKAVKTEKVKVKVAATVKPIAKTAPVEKVEATAPVEVEKKAVNTSTSSARRSLSLDVYGLDGKVGGKVSVAGEMFGAIVNKSLLAQAIRVYLANQRQGTASTKTRGEVQGSSRKIYRQKGTGRARHGSIRAPIFVKGGVVFGPRPHDYSLDLPKKMKRKALFSALSAKVAGKEVTIVDGFETLTPKTKNFVTVLQKLGLEGKKKSILLVTDAKAEKVRRAGRNVQGVNFAGAVRLNAYEVLKSKNLIIMKEALAEMEKTFLGK